MAPEVGAASLATASLTAVAAISTAAIAIRLADALPAVWIAAGRVSITALVLAPLCRSDLREMLSALCKQPQLILHTIVASLCLALHFGAWIASLSTASVIASVALMATQPLWATVLGRTVGDRIPNVAYLGAVVAILGGWVMSNTQVGSPIGMGLASAGAIFAAGYFAVGRLVRSRLPLPSYLFTVHGIAAILLVEWAASTTTFPVNAWLDDWPLVVYLGLVPGLVGHGLLNWTVRHIELHIVSMLVLLEPIGAGVLAWIFLGETPHPREVTGALLMLTGVIIGGKPAKVPEA